ncbi:MAG: P-II family nitrogen regulator [Pleurocapsa sp.]
MKKIEAVIHAHKLDDVKLALVNSGIIGMTISDVKGFGHRQGNTTVYRGNELKIEFVSKIKIEVVVEEEQADLVVAQISLAGRTGEIGDGKIILSTIEEIVRIRTSETGFAAI